MYICPHIKGEMAEWSKAHAWNACTRKRVEGSNPSFSSNFTTFCTLVHEMVKQRKAHVRTESIPG